MPSAGLPWWIVDGKKQAQPLDRLRMTKGVSWRPLLVMVSPSINSGQALSNHDIQCF